MGTEFVTVCLGALVLAAGAVRSLFEIVHGERRIPGRRARRPSYTPEWW